MKLSTRNQLIVGMVAMSAKEKYRHYLQNSFLKNWWRNGVPRSFKDMVEGIQQIIIFMIILVSPIFWLISLPLYPVYLVGWSVYESIRLKRIKNNWHLEKSLENFRLRGDWRKDR